MKDEMEKLRQENHYLKQLLVKNLTVDTVVKQAKLLAGGMEI
ncbi:hypothetical protein [Sporosarcina sp. FSL K6-2383]